MNSPALSRVISVVQRSYLSNTHATEIEENGYALIAQQEVTCLLVLVLRDQSTGESR